MRSDYPAEIEVESNEGQNVRYRLAPEFFCQIFQRAAPTERTGRAKA